MTLVLGFSLCCSAVGLTCPLALSEPTQIFSATLKKVHAEALAKKGFIVISHPEAKRSFEPDYDLGADFSQLITDINSFVGVEIPKSEFPQLVIVLENESSLRGIGGTALAELNAIEVRNPDSLTRQQLKNLIAHEYGHIILDRWRIRLVKDPKMKLALMEYYKARLAENMAYKAGAYIWQNSKDHSQQPDLYALLMNMDLRVSTWSNPIRTANSSYDELFADVTASVFFDGPINSELLGIVGKGDKPDERDFMAEADYSANQLSTFHGAFIHMRSWLGHNILNKPMSVRDKRRLLTALAKSIVAETTDLYLHKHGTLNLDDFQSMWKPNSQQVVEELNLSLLRRFLDLYGRP